MSELQDLTSDPLFQRSNPDQQATILGAFFDTRLDDIPVAKKLRPELLQAARNVFVTKNLPSGLLGGDKAQLVPAIVAKPEPSNQPAADLPTPRTFLGKASDVAEEAAKSAVLAPIAPLVAAQGTATKEAADFARKGFIRQAQGNPRGPIESMLEASLRGAMMGGVVNRRDEPPSLKNTLLDALEIAGGVGGLASLGAENLARAEKVVANGAKIAARIGPEEGQLLGQLGEKIAEAKAAVKSPAAPTMTPPAPAAKGTPAIGQFNLERFADPEVRNILAQTQQDSEVQAKIFAAKRGVVTDDQVKLLADQVDLTPEKLKKLAPGTVLNAEEMYKANQVLGGVGKATANLVEKYRVAKEAGDPKLLGSIVGDAQQLMSPMVDVMVKTRAIASELGRALRQQRIAIEHLSPIEKNLLDLSVKDGGLLSMDRTEELLSKLSDIDLTDPTAVTRALAQHLKPSIADKFIEVATAMKLTNPVTYLRNAVGNSLAIITRVAEKTAGGPIDFLRSTLTGTPRERFLGEAGSYAFGVGQGLHDATLNFLGNLMGESAEAVGKTGEAIRGPAVGGLPGKVVQVPFKLLNATDEFFKTLLRRGDLYAQALRQAAKEGLQGSARWGRIEELVANPPPAFLKSADESALEYSYQMPLGEFGQTLNKARGMLGGLPKLIIPFFKTPVNVGKFIIQRSPLGLLSPRNIADLKAGGAAATEAISRMTVGSAISGLFVKLALEGYITGAGPDNKAERDTLQRSGWLPRALHLGDKYISYSGFDPLASTMGTAADVAEAWLRRREQPASDLIAKMAFGVMDNLTDQPFLTGVHDFLDALRDERKMGKFLDAFGGGFVPTGSGLVARSLDKVVRKPEGIVQNLEARIPGLSQNVPPKLNVFGEPVTRETTFPIAASTEKISPLETELQRLNQSLNFNVSFRGNRIAGRKLDQDEQQALQKQAGQQIKAKMEDLVASDRYQQLTDPMKKRAIEKIERDVSEKVQDRLSVGVELRALGLPDLQKLPLPEDLKNTITRRLKVRIDTRQYRDKPDAQRRLAVQEKIRDVLNNFTGGTQ